MSILLYTISLCTFIRYFYAIGVWYFGFIPLIIIGVIIIMSSQHLILSISATEKWQKYSIFVAWLAILAGMAGIGQFFSDNTVTIGLTLVTINIVMWLGSYLRNYDDGKSIGQLGYYSSIIYIIVQSSYLIDRHTLTTIFSLFWVLTLSLVGFIVGIIGHRKRIESYVNYMLLILCGGAMMIAVGTYLSDIYTALLVDSILLLGWSFAMRHILAYQIPTSSQTKNISLRRILAGEKMNRNTHIPHTSRLKIRLHEFIKKMPLLTKYIFEATNCGLVLLTITLYLNNITTAASQRHQLVYRLIIVLFIVTAFLLKSIGFTSVLQKMTLFAVINFAIYLTLYILFDASLGAIAGWAIVWNIMSSILIFYGPSSFLANILQKQDYRYRIIMTVIALCINIYLLGLTLLPGQLVFSLAFIYCGIQGMLLYYGVRHIDQLDG